MSAGYQDTDQWGRDPLDADYGKPPRRPLPFRKSADRDADHCRRCSLCEGMDHHWMAHCDDDTPDPIMVCKHCPATREMTDDDE